MTWLEWLLKDFAISITTLAPAPLLSYNTGAISIPRDPMNHELTKQVSVYAYWVIALKYVPLKS